MNKKLVCLLVCGFTGMWSEMHYGLTENDLKLVDFKDTDEEFKDADSDVLDAFFNFDDAYSWVKRYAEDIASKLVEANISIVTMNDIYQVLQDQSDKNKNYITIYEDLQSFVNVSTQDQNYVLGAVQAIINVMMEQRNIAATKIQKVVRDRKDRKENKKMRQQRKQLEQSVPKLLELLQEVEQAKIQIKVNTKKWKQDHLMRVVNHLNDFDIKKYRLQIQDLEILCRKLNIPLNNVNKESILKRLVEILEVKAQSTSKTSVRGNNIKKEKKD